MNGRDKSWIGVCLTGVEVIAGALFAFIFCIELINVVLRHGFKSGIPQSTEGAAFALAVITFLGIAPAFLANEHVKLQVFQRLFRGVARKGIVIFAEAATFVTLISLTYLGCVNVVKFYKLPFAPSSMPWLPYWIPMSAVPLGMGLGALALLRRWYVVRNDNSGADDAESKSAPLD